MTRKRVVHHGLYHSELNKKIYKILKRTNRKCVISDKLFGWKLETNLNFTFFKLLTTQHNYNFSATSPANHLVIIFK